MQYRIRKIKIFLVKNESKDFLTYELIRLKYAFEMLFSYLWKYLIRNSNIRSIFRSKVEIIERHNK